MFVRNSESICCTSWLSRGGDGVGAGTGIGAASASAAFVTMATAGSFALAGASVSPKEGSCME